MILILHKRVLKNSFGIFSSYLILIIHSSFSDEMYNFEMESEEDEDEIIERRRKERQAILTKYTVSTSQPVSIATSVTSKASDSDSDSSSSDESEDSTTVEQRAKEDFERDLEWSSSQNKKGSISKEEEDSQDALSKEKTEGKDDESSKNGDMFGVDDMFSENYEVSFLFPVFLLFHTLYSKQHYLGTNKIISLGRFVQVLLLQKRDTIRKFWTKKKHINVLYWCNCIAAVSSTQLVSFIYFFFFLESRWSVNDDG